MKRLFFVFSFILIGSTLFSQTIPESFLVTHRPEYMLPSPEVISRIKHIERPSGLSTGIPEISIPLWHNNMSNYSINLKYHAGGIQVNELSSCVGMGWSLDAGGFVARVVRGLPDDLPGLGFLYLPEDVKILVASDLDLYDNTDAFDLVDIQEYDLSPDIFYYSFNGITGKFIFDSDGNIMTIPRSNIKITAEYDQDTLKRFIIQTTNGIKYRFGTREKVTIDSSSIELPYSSYYSAWFIQNGRGLTKESVSYTYANDDPITYELNRNLYEYVYYDLRGQQSGVVNTHLTIKTPRLISISDINSNAIFNYGENDDLISIQVSGHEQNFFNTTNDIYDQNPRNEPPEAPKNTTSVVKDIILNYGNYQTNNSSSSYLRTRRLDSVKIGKIIQGLYEDSGFFKKYSLSYNSLPLPDENSLKSDVWGYYNDEQNNSLIPRLEYVADNYEYLFPISGEVISGEERIINSTTIKAGILEQIENPQGGVTEYFYEPNDFYIGDSTIQGAGLRVDSIKYYDSNNNLPEKVIDYHYTYVDNQTESTGVLLSKPNFAYNLLIHPGSNNIDSVTFRYAHYSYGLMPTTGNPLYYKQVTIEDGLGYTVKDFELAIPDNMISNIFSNQLDSGKIVEQGDYIAEIKYLGAGFRPNFCYDWSSPYMHRSRVFDKNDTLLTETIFEYSEIEAPVTVFGFYSGVNTTYINESEYKRRAILSKYFYPSGWRVLTQKTQIEYKQTNEFKRVVTNFKYYNLNEDFRFLKGSSWIDINGNTHFKKLKYPFNYVDNADYAFRELNDSVNKYEYRLSRYLEGYVNMHNNEEYYDNHTILPTSITYISGYNSDSIAEPQIVKDADENLVALLTLNARGQIGSPVENVDGIIVSGDSVITSASISTLKKHDLQVVADKNYVIQGPVTVNPEQLSGVENCEFRKSLHYSIVKEYTQYNEDGRVVEIKDATGATTSFDWSVLGNYLLSKTFNTSQTVSYTYLPLIGIESQTNANGNKTSYHYDAYGDLVAKKDMDNNIREIYYYNTINGDKTKFEYGQANLLNPNANLEIISIADNGLDITFRIDDFDSKYEYMIDYGDGSSEIIISDEVMHTYSQLGDYEVNLKVKLKGITLNEVFKVITVFDPTLDVTYSYLNTDTNDILSSIDGVNVKGLKITVNVSSGSESHSIKWTLTNELTGAVKFKVDNLTSTEFSEYLIEDQGAYILKCTVSNGVQSAIKIWNFVIQ